VTGGRLLVGLTDCLRVGTFFGPCSIPGECEEAEVGVEVLLKGPGDSDNRVEALLLCAVNGVGGGRFWVESLCGVPWSWLADREVAVVNGVGAGLGPVVCRIEEVGGMLMPRIAPGNGSL
jgi:hypothetical protein